jgi:acyl carrier protein phosphodiesterase
MNYLAHAYLSFEKPEILVGNMISDFVKGKKRYDFPKGIQLGITLHREIDRFTDEHAALKNAKEIFRPAYRLYCAPLVDVVFDHFLAIDTNEFTEDKLRVFTKETYDILNKHTEFFPEKFKLMFPYMQSQNWLYNYRNPWGIEKSLGGLVRRSKYMTESDTAFRLFTENYQELENCYRAFFPEVKDLAAGFLDTYQTTGF